MLPAEWQGVRRVLAVRLDNIGDVVLLGPALRAVREALPDAEITLMASPAGSLVAPMLPWVDRLLTQRVVWQDASGAMPLDPHRELALVETIRAGRYDAALIFTSFSQSPYPPAYVCYLAGVPLRAGQSREFGGSLLTHRVKPLPDSTHQAERNLFLVESVGLPVRRRDLELHVPEEARARADSLLSEAGIGEGEPFVAIAPGASCAARRYDPVRFGQAARLVGQRSGLPVVMLGSERETELAAEVTGAAGGAGAFISLVGKTSIPELAAVTGRASLLIANDSGPMHIADALRTPMLILFSGTELESQWEPRSAPTCLLRRPTPCSPCYAFQCPYNMECLDFPPDEVASEALGLLATTTTHYKESISISARPQAAGGAKDVVRR